MYCMHSEGIHRQVTIKWWPTHNALEDGLAGVHHVLGTVLAAEAILRMEGRKEQLLLTDTATRTANNRAQTETFVYKSAAPKRSLLLD